MARRLLDFVCAAVALVCTAPLLGLAAIGIKLSSPGPVLFRTRRVGLNGRQFVMYKLRTMHQDHGGIRSRVTGAVDPRVFPFGMILRKSKVDELPQLINILLGQMAIVGPRPEVPGVVARHYAPLHRETLNVRPGLTSPGSLFHYTRGEQALTGPDPEQRYFDAVLPTKLALDIVYVRRASLGYDLAIITRTVGTIAAMLAGKKSFAEPWEMEDARNLIMPARNTRVYRPSPSSSTGPLGGPAPSHAVFAALLVGAVLQAGCSLGPETAPEYYQFSGGPSSGGPTPPSEAGGTRPPVMFLGMGNMSSCEDGPAAMRFAALLDRVPGTIYSTGSHFIEEAADDDCYGRGFGKFKNRTRPAPGEYDYSDVYFRYFGASAGRIGEGWYSYDLGTWHVVALNSNADMGAGSPQLEWLRRDLIAARNRGRCTIAYWHHPRFASGRSHGDRALTQPVWDLLYDAGVEIVLNGHESHYERFAPQAPDGSGDWQYGIRQFIVGTGSEADASFGIMAANSERRRSGTPGLLALTLREGAYDWRFYSVDGEAFVDEGSGSCHDAPPWAPSTFRRRAPVDLVAATTEYSR